MTMSISCCYSETGLKNMNVITMDTYDKKTVEEFATFWKINSDNASLHKEAIIKAFEFYNKIYGQNNQNIHDLRNIQYVCKNLRYLYFAYKNNELKFTPSLIEDTNFKTKVEPVEEPKEEPVKKDNKFKKINK